MPVPVDLEEVVEFPRDDDKVEEEDEVTVDVVDGTLDAIDVDDCEDAEEDGKDVVEAGEEDADEGVLTLEGVEVVEAPETAKWLPMEVKVVHKDDDGIGWASGVTGSPWWNVEAP